MKTQFIAHLTTLQENIVAGLIAIDTKASVVKDAWTYEKGTGGGLSCVISDGNIFEKGGVNFSQVEGELPEIIAHHFQTKEKYFFACGVSIVIHPLNPFVPTIHANWRLFELYNEHKERTDFWIGGGSDLTPYYVFPDDAKYFHTTLKTAVEKYDQTLYNQLKKNCDDYFSNKHRQNEQRGIGGIFYDYMRINSQWSEQQLFDFSMNVSNTFLPSYLPIVKKRKDTPYGKTEIHWQEIRRGRYVEFNLIHDRGTLFGLKTQGRTESILMSMPPRAQWKYNYNPPLHSKEYEQMQYFQPIHWVDYN